MRSRLVELVLILCFAAAAGQIAWWTFFCPLPAETLGRNRLRSLQAPGERLRNLYVRHNLHLPGRPESAWIRVQGPDIVELYVNGRFIDAREAAGTDTAIAVDLTRLLRTGKNVVGAVCRQSTLYRRPELAIEGAYVLPDGTHHFGVDDPWRCRPHFERTHDYWFAVDFDDSHWPLCTVAESELLVRKGPLEQALITPSTSTWFAPGELTARDVVVQRAFHLPAPVESGWLRLQSNASYRLAVNDEVVGREEARYGTSLPVRPGRELIYDLAPLVRSGDNMIILRLHAPTPPPQVAVEVNLQLRDGSNFRVVGDDDWLWRPVIAGGRWQTDATDTHRWRNCHVVDVVEGRQPWEVTRSIVPLTRDWTYVVRQFGKRVVLVLLIAVGTWLVTRVVVSLGRNRHTEPGSCLPLPLLSLVPATLFLGAGILAEYDPRISASWIYNPIMLHTASAIVLLQWLGIGVVARRSRRTTRRAGRRMDPTRLGLRARVARPGMLVWLTVVVIFSVGTYLRYRDIEARPLSPDEVTVYRASVNIWEFGFPTIVVKDNSPPIHASTSELVFWGGGITSLFTDDDRLIVRLVPTLYASLTALLIFWVGAKMLNPWIGVAAAAIYALAPPCIAMANLGRYYSQLQFFALLVTYQFWRTIEPRGGLNHRALWCTVAAFVAMFLSWEGSALLAVPLMVAALAERRDRVGSLFLDPQVWFGMVTVGVVVVLQGAHRTLEQTARPLIGSGASDISLTPMWRYPGFDPWTYVLPASWNHDGLLPVLGLVLAAGCLVARNARRRQLQMLFIVFLTGAILQAVTLPVTATRYSYHFVPHFVLLAAAAIVLATRELVRDWRRSPRSSTIYARGVALATVLCFIALSSGLVLSLNELRDWRLSGKRLDAIKLPGQDVTASYVQAHRRPGDVVIVNAPHVMDHYLDQPSDYWLESQLHLQAVVDEEQPIPLHRYKGAVMLRDVEHLREVFARHERVWLITEPGFNARTNKQAVVTFLRANMDVVFEDYGSLVLLKDNSHRNSVLQQKSERTLTRGRSYLP